MSEEILKSIRVFDLTHRIVIGPVRASELSSRIMALAFRLKLV
jgi:hypothetical protein